MQPVFLHYFCNNISFEKCRDKVAYYHPYLFLQFQKGISYSLHCYFDTQMFSKLWLSVQCCQTMPLGNCVYYSAFSTGKCPKMTLNKYKNNCHLSLAQNCHISRFRHLSDSYAQRIHQNWRKFGFELFGMAHKYHK